jgi:hypothetical protein
VGFVFAYFYFMGGRLDAKHGERRNHGPLWALASMLITAFAIEGLGGGWLLVIIGQIALFVGITLWRVIYEK